eukprot:gene17701-20163_t
MSIEQSADYLLSRTEYRPVVGIICGSGLSELSKCMSNKETIPYQDIPGFVNVSVPGHTGELVFGLINDVQCVCMRGRFHYYEDNTMEQCVHPVKVMRLLGVKLLIVTNAAGGLNPSYNVGDIMVIQDHFGLVTLAGHHPLRGANDDSLGTRFPPMSDAYDKTLQQFVVDAATKLNLSHKVRLNGTYAYACGPSYESMAEVRFLKSAGCDSVGASTVPEVIAARNCGMQVLGLSIITNAAVTHRDEPAASHEEVLAAVDACAVHVEALVRGVLHKSIVGSYLAAQPNFYHIPSPTDSAVHTPNSHTPAAGNHRTAGANVNTGTSSEARRNRSLDPDAEDEFNNAVVSVIALGAIVLGLFVVLKRK